MKDHIDAGKGVEMNAQRDGQGQEMVIAEIVLESMNAATKLGPNATTSVGKERSTSKARHKRERH